jgi:hypothetical protein
MYPYVTNNYIQDGPCNIYNENIFKLHIHHTKVNNVRLVD